MVLCALALGCTSTKDTSTSSVVPADAVAESPDPDALRVQANAFIARFKQTMEAGDPAKIRGLYVSDGRLRWVTDGEVRYTSVDDIVEGLAEVKGAGMVFDTAYSAVEALALSGDTTLVTARFDTAATMTHGPGFSFGGVVTMVVERDGESQMRIVAGHTSTPGGPPPREELVESSKTR